MKNFTLLVRLLIICFGILIVSCQQNENLIPNNKNNSSAAKIDCNGENSFPIGIASPLHGSVVNAGNSLKITWLFSLCSTVPEYLDIYLYRGNTKIMNIALHVSSYNQVSNTNGYIEYGYNWTIPTSLCGYNDYKIRVTKYNAALIYSDSNAFSIVNPTYTYCNWIISPNGGDYIASGSSPVAVPISWNASLVNASSVKIEVFKKDSQSDLFIFDRVATNSAPNTGSYTYYFDLPQGIEYKIKITSNSNPNIFDYSDGSFYVIFD
ncbi:Ser-Thr-rich GPI-anchored membrane family protein [Xanthocytophaga agilis]|uniref:Ser-Thr-rich GPI-anchored membrane family protein n=1 Tax=Xanthocytophaga agilis TaxID=3048010 RepID=A0AAE3R463_9BACT|nr:Ser-Thr-rich GPI-anchored membrane family protein [Xanthocytophaga agilis]MDJ1503414.1 Ser-Thr-rich GPI-anchored membrane family protein [Xanthocytophaga agilis]